LTQCLPECLIISFEHASRPGQRLGLLLVHLRLPFPDTHHLTLRPFRARIPRLLPDKLGRYGRAGMISGTFDRCFCLDARPSARR
jgi:hypothetical protein